MSLKFAVLAALHEQPATGYDLTRNFRTRMANVWNASHQQIYRELSKMTEEGLLEVEDVPQDSRPDRKLYRLSDAGIADLANWLTESQGRPPTRDPLLVKLFGGDLVDPESLMAEITRQRQNWRQELDRYRDIEAEYFSAPEQVPFRFRLQHLALRKGIRSMESNLAWADEVVAVLNHEIKSRS
ncbi:PadR family transcriptional regulator [Marinobacter zhanjiangensis]|uniref:PadR family transcriptional regulator n=1 Tax=Marinobacter zhanjiangensis TaxID=578215 RepID=A0ABQ3B1T3_9GAMM|nr:PadR family transcriptional regulator [Marinobacter zhanjiangensis]GGY74916.1 PadR family transcriptional regulator [Marinobacter zhanjiangensis]